MIGTDELRNEASALLLEWARTAARYYGPTGSMNYDLSVFPDADGPSFYNQFAHYALLLFSEGVVSGATDPERDQFRTLALKNIEYMLELTDDEYLTPHYSCGRDWGRTRGEWQYNFFFRSLKIIERRNLGTQDFRARLRKVLLGGAEKFSATYVRHFREHPGEEGFVGNHATWIFLLLYEVGQYCENHEWMELAERAMATRVVAEQRPDGSWPEGGGIVVTYGMVTALAVSLYAELSGNRPARSACEKAFGFFRYLSFDDGTSSVAADCRMRRHNSPSMFIAPGFIRCVGGAEFALARIRKMRDVIVRGDVHYGFAQALAFYANFVEYVVSRTEMPDAETVPSEMPGNLPVARIENDEWTAFLSYQLNAESPSGFHLDAQNFIEVFHRKAGYLVGGGNSKYGPRFSTFRKKTGGRAYIPTAARLVKAGKTQAECEYEFDGDLMSARVEIEAGRLSIRFKVLRQARPDDIYEAAVFLCVAPGDRIELPERETEKKAESIDPRRRIFFEFEGTLLWRGCEFCVPGKTELYYPAIPHNPYTQDCLPLKNGYVLRLGLQIGREEKVLTVAQR